jgi:hypothetical protein
MVVAKLGMAGDRCGMTRAGLEQAPVAGGGRARGRDDDASGS